MVAGHRFTTNGKIVKVISNTSSRLDSNTHSRNYTCSQQAAYLSSERPVKSTDHANAEQSAKAAGCQPCAAAPLGSCQHGSVFCLGGGHGTVMGGMPLQPEAVGELLLDSVITQEVNATSTSAAFNALHELLVIGCVPDSPSVMCGNTRRKLPVQQHVCRAICYLFSS